MAVWPSSIAGSETPRRAVLWLGLGAAAIAASVLAGWLLDIAALRSALDTGTPMRANAALAVLVCGLTIAVLSRPRVPEAARALAAMAGSAVALLALLTLSQDFVGWDLGIDEWLARDLTRSVRVASPGRMSPPTALSLLVLGIGLALVARRPGAGLRAPGAAAMGVGAILIGSIAVLGYLAERLMGIGFLSYSRISVSAAFCLVLLGVALLARLRDEGGLDWALDHATTAGFVAGIVAMVVTAGVSYQFATQMRDDTRRLRAALETMAEIRKLHVLLGEFTLSAGRYLITNDESGLSARERTKSDLRRSMEGLRSTMADRPGQLQALERMIDVHRRRVELSEEIIATHRARVRTGRSQGPRDPSPLGRAYPALGIEIEQLAHRLEAAEQVRLDTLQREAEANATRTFLMLPLGVLLGLALLPLGLFLSNWNARERIRADARFRTLVENVPAGITMTGADGRILSANENAARMLGYRSVAAAIADLRDDSSKVYADPETRSAYLRRLREHGTVRGMEVELVRHDGSRFWASLDGRLVHDGGAEPSLVTIMDDITLRREQAHRIARLSRVKAMQSGINAAVVRIRERQALLDEVCRVAVELGGLRAAWVAWHDQGARLLRPAASAGHLDGYLEVVRLATDGDAAGIAAGVLRRGASAITNDVGGSRAFRHREAALKRGFLSAMHLPLKVGGETEGVLILYAGETGFFDDEEQVLLDELAADVSFALDALDKSARLDFLAYYDPLTGLPNRSLFHDRLAHSLRQRGGEPRLVAVILLDLERFRQVNETLGRGQGDELLRRVGERLQRAGESAARIGSDQFALTLRGARTAAEVSRALEAVVAATFSRPFPAGGEELLVACRAGVAIFPDDGADADALMRNAEAALKRSKTAGERITFYSPDMNARVAESLALENRLRRAVEQRQFVLHYQPKVRLADGRLAGAEALIRWQVPGGELVPPGRFIPLLEETGLIVEVGRWAMAQAFRDLNAWAAAGLAVPRIAVNVSALQLQRRDFVDVVIGEIERGGDHPDWLELEITEGMVMRNVEDSTRKLSILRGMGVTVAIDDFGTGYSSLGYLSRLPVDTLKIDRSFVLGLSGGEQARNLVATIIALGAGLKLKVVAEGVETAEQADLLRALGCDEGQGYLFSRPLPADALAAFLAAGASQKGR